MKAQTQFKKEKPITNVDKNTGTNQKSKWTNIGLWILQVALSAMFIMAGGSKLLGVPEMIILFENIGFGQWFRYLTGILEIVSAVLIVIPTLSAIGGLLLASIMLGAVLTHLFLIGGSIAMPGFYLILSFIVIWGRWNRIVRYRKI